MGKNIVSRNILRGRNKDLKKCKKAHKNNPKIQKYKILIILMRTCQLKINYSVFFKTLQS